MNYHHLSMEERSCIRKYYTDGLSYREIARLIRRSVSTVSREIRRKCTHMYDIPSYYPSQLVKTNTCDRGTEFANWRHIEGRLHCEVYFADPYCAWQKGTSENLNGLLREFYSKGRNFSRIAPAILKRNLALLNARPRKVLNFRSA